MANAPGGIVLKMKTYKNLYPGICSFENLRQAFQLAARSKRSKSAVADFEYHLEENLVKLQQELQEQSYSEPSTNVANE